MPIAPAAQTRVAKEENGAAAGRLARLRGLARRSFVRELLILLGFCALTALVTWPYVTRLRDAVADPGDPYLVAWVLWWDYHATFTNPLNLFHSNLFYPYRYTLAFSEHCWGLALPFFPLFALGARPLTVHAVALFFGFAFCGYGAFRLTRTLTGSDGAAWVAGIVFAFVPYRFQLLSQLPYLFSPWMPLLFEALVLFARVRSGRRAVWLGAAFLMTGLTTLTWFFYSLVPFGLAALILSARYGLWRERAFWVRGALALGAASLLLLPFMLPYYVASKMYGFTRSVAEIKAHSAWPVHWFAAEARNKFWAGFGGDTPEGWKFRLFPGLLPLLLPLAALLKEFKEDCGLRIADRGLKDEGDASSNPQLAIRNPQSSRLTALDVFVVFAFVASVFALGYEGLGVFGGVFRHVTSERALAALSLAVIARLCVAYPRALRVGGNANLSETLRSARRGDAFWLGVMLAAVGFFYSLGWNFFFYRILYDLLPFFKSMRVPTRGAMVAYLGLAVLSGLGARALARLTARKWPRVRPAYVYVALCALLLFELNAAPLHFMRGEIYPDAVTLRLKETGMRGGVVMLPAGGEFNHAHTLRAADHGKPQIVGTSGFNPPYETQIEVLTRVGPITSQFLDLLEQIPASYVVVRTHLVAPERRNVYENFFARAVAGGRLRFVRRFDGRDDLYAVVKTEPEAESEGPLPFRPEAREWASMVEEDPVNLLGQYLEWSRRLFRLHVAVAGALPRYAEYMRDVREVGRGVVPGMEEDDGQIKNNFRAFAEARTRRPDFQESFGPLSDEQYVARLYANAGVAATESELAALRMELSAGRADRAAALLRVVEDPRFVEAQQYRSLVLLHFFGYLRRNPDDPPDKNMDGFLHWVYDLERSHDTAKLSSAFASSFEYEKIKQAEGK